MEEVAFDLPYGRMDGAERAGEDIPSWRSSVRRITEIRK